MSQFEKTELSAYVAAKCMWHKEKRSGGYILLVSKKNKGTATFKKKFLSQYELNKIFYKR